MTYSRRGLLLLGLAVGVGGCARPAARSPDRQPLAPEDHLPSSLDVVVRVDLGKLRRAMPDLAEVARSSASGDDDGVRAKLVEVIAGRGREIWVGARDRSFDDLVVAASGDFELLDLGPGFTATDEGPNERVLERDVAKRGAPAWILHRKTSLVVVTPGLVDAVSRTRARAERSAHDVPRDGVIGFSARARALVGDAAAQKAPFASMTLAEGSFDIEAGILRGTLVATFKTDASADQAVRVAQALLDRERDRGREALLSGVAVVRQSSFRVAITAKIPANVLRRTLGR